LLILLAGLLFSCKRSTIFKLISSGRTGIDFNNIIVETDSFNLKNYEYIYNGAGVGIGDLNNDGLQDIIFAGNLVSPKVYLNKGNFKFKNITPNFEGLTDNQWYSGVAIVDINSDGWLDVYLTTAAGKAPEKCRNRLWISNGNPGNDGPRFTEMADKYGIADKSESVTAAFFDYDRDGDLDLYILSCTLNQRMNLAYRPRITDGSAPNNDKLYQNNGDGTFTDVTIPAGIVFEGFGLGLAIGDVNKDGYPDIYVSNDYTTNDVLYINQGDGTFRNEIKRYLSYQTASSMGNDMADVNNDGNPDILTLDMMPEYYYKKKQTINGFSYIYYIYDEEFGYEHQYLRNMLHLHNGFLRDEMLPFSEVGQLMGVYQSDWSWAPLFADYDNDGDKDLIITNGYPQDLTDKDWAASQQKAHGFRRDKKDVAKMMPPVKVPNIAFENTSDLSFSKTTDWLPDVPSFSYGASFADLDNDGDLDYVVNNLNDKAFILRNNTMERSKNKSRFIKIRLKGKTGNTMAIGAKVELWNNGHYQFYEHFLSRGYASSVDPVVHFGIPFEALIDSIKVTWPASGYITILKNIGANQTIEINETNSLPPGRVMKVWQGKELLFRKYDDRVNYVHNQKDFVDFFLSQKIIPHKFSQIGPCMAKGDINSDGYEDLIIGSTNQLPTTVFLRKGTEFKRSEIKGLTTQKEFSESDLVILDFDRDGDNDVIAVAGGYENKQENENQRDLYMAISAGYDIRQEAAYRHYLYENHNGSFVQDSLPVPPFLASVVRTCDFNHDGFTDLFIGSRVKKGRFPYAGDSWLILNDNGKPSVKSYSQLKLGMVTDAVWTDYDKDGWEDLLVAREWDALVLLRNNMGRELVPQNIPDLENKYGIWYSITTGDFDQDGDDDYIAGNLGENHRFTVSDEYPLSLYVLDLELDGILDPLVTSYWKDQHGKMTEYPVNYLDELREQSSFFQMKFNDYTSFSLTGIGDMLDENMLKRLQGKLKVNITSSYLIWNDKGNFRWEKLPVSLQVSPIKRTIVQDFNADGYPDVLVAGNDYTYDVSTGYFDANKGLVLLNNGKGSFEVLTPSESGLFLQGMIESLLYLAGDTSFIVAGINRARVAVFKQINSKSLPFK